MDRHEERSRSEAEERQSTDEEALELHARGRPGKIEIAPTKPLATARDLSLAYCPGVAAPCLAIQRDPVRAYDYTAKGNLVAVISNGTAVLGLGNLGALASKPVMEGKAVLFKRFADIDCDRPRGRHRATSTSSSTACGCSGPPSAASTSRTSRRPSASSSSSACAS